MSKREYMGSTPIGQEENTPLDGKMEFGKQLPTAKRKTLRDGLKEIYYVYCSNSSLHGVQYLGQKRPWKEICFWLCIFTISIYYCSQTIAQIYQKWDDTPVIVSFSERSTPISAIPFPAITICPEARRKGGSTGKCVEIIRMGNFLRAFRFV